MKASTPRLVNLAPAGLGTMLVESIASYVMRLAAQYSISTIALLRTGLPDLIPVSYGGRGRPTEVAKSGAYAVGMTRTSEQWVAGLEAATGLAGLRSLTLLNLAPSVSANRLPRTQLASCRACLDEMAAAGLVWEPLIWTLQPVMTCPVHGLTLSLECPHCGGSQKVLRLRGRPGLCGRCGLWMGQGLPVHVEAPDPVSLMVASLFEGDLIVSDNLAKTLNAGLARAGWTAAHLSETAQVPKASLSGWRAGLMKPGLGPLVAICQATGWDLRAFLAGEIVQIAAPAALPDRPSARRGIDWSFVSMRLREMTALAEPPTLRAASIELAVDVHAIRKQLPTEAGRLVARRRELESAASKRRRDERTAVVSELTIKILEAGGRPSRRDLEPLLPDGWQLRERALGDAWRAAQAEWAAGVPARQAASGTRPLDGRAGLRSSSFKVT